MLVRWNLILQILSRYIVTMHGQNVHMVFNFVETIREINPTRN